MRLTSHRVLCHFVEIIACGGLLLVLAAADAIAAESPALEFSEFVPGAFLHVGKHDDMSVENLGDIANIGFIVGTQSVAVIDPGGSPAVSRAMHRAIREHTELPISHVFMTHVHPDHLLGGIEFSEVEHVVVHENFPRAVAQRGTFYTDRFAALFNDDDQGSRLLEPTQLVNVGTPLQIELGERTLTVRAHATAHTDNDLTVFDESTQTLWAADLLFAERMPSLDGSLTGWLKVMDELAAFQPERVVPGHGQPGDWSKLANLQRDYLTQLLDQTREYIAANKRLSEAVEGVAQDNATRWQLFELHHPGNVTKAYTELEWE